MTQCALWYMRHYSPGYQLFDSEEEAARSAVYMEDDGQAAVLGVQFPDGRTVKRDDWPAWGDAKRWWREQEQRQEEEWAATPKPVTRKTRDPFRGWEVEIRASEPEWLGTDQRNPQD